VAYLAAIAVPLLFPSTSGVIDAIRPACGIALAFLPLNPSSAWLRLLPMFAVIHLAGDLMAGRSFVASLGFDLSDAAETLLGAWVFTRWCRGEGVTFTRLRESLVLLAVATAVNGATAVLAKPFGLPDLARLIHARLAAA
jgi:hypothetical protein